MIAQGCKVLVVEDNSLNRELLQAVLEAAGFAVLTADDAISGIELAKRELPDVVLMDVQLPELDGLEATRLLSEDAATADIPVVAVTAHVKKEDEERSIAAGCVLHIPKPVDTRALPDTVMRVIDEAVAKRNRRSAVDAEDPGSSSVGST